MEYVLLVYKNILADRTELKSHYKPQILMAI